MQHKLTVRCIGCGRHMSHHKLCNQLPEGVEAPALPRAGDRYFCTQCGQLGEFMEDLQLRRLTTDEILQVPVNVKLLAVITRARYLHMVVRDWRN